ncbi:MAG: hypothetical protein SGI90_05810 [Candidatus Eisenbacteria bacterium]|nr:hypothetical protein [Candidatus Eisenbacteria bacterium]
MPSLRNISRLGGLITFAGLTACSDEGSGTTAPFRGDRQPAPVTAAAVLNEDFTSRQVFPTDNWWNHDITTAPVDPNSQAFINWISGRTPQNPTATRRLHPDFGPPPYGIPYVGVDGTQARLSVTFVLHGNESDAGAPGMPAGYPIPIEARTLPNYIEGGVIGGGTSGDRHLILIDRDNWLLFETWATRWNSALNRWEAGSGAVFNLATNDRRPDGWTSADAAGLAIFPGLIRVDEAFGAGEIFHAFRFTTRATNGYVWPASHTAGSDPSAPPMGTRLRMKATTNIAGYTPELQRIFRAMKRHGLILADNGSDMYIQGTMDSRWDNDILNPAFHGLDADDFEVIQLGWQPQVSSVP